MAKVFSCYDKICKTNYSDSDCACNTGHHAPHCLNSATDLQWPSSTFWFTHTTKPNHSQKVKAVNKKLSEMWGKTVVASW